MSRSVGYLTYLYGLFVHARAGSLPFVGPGHPEYEHAFNTLGLKQEWHWTPTGERFLAIKLPPQDKHSA